MTTIGEISEAVRSVAQAVGPSVVGVAGRPRRPRRSEGSGIVVASGRVLTNAHNLWGEVDVSFADGRTAPGRPVGIDPDGDLGVLETDTGGAPAVAWADAAPELGSAVFGVADPGGRGLRVTFGLVSGTERSFRGPRGRRIDGSIEHTAPLLPGSSGGPLVYASGAVVGINTHRLGEGFYLAIAADEAMRERIDALARGEQPEGARLGVAVAPPSVTRKLRRAVGLPEVDGLLVRGVEDDSPAARAGLREGDVLVEADGRLLVDADALLAVVEASSGAIEVKIVRGTETLTVKVGR